MIAVTKTVPLGSIKQAADYGFRIFGESRIQEAQEKIDPFRGIQKREGYLNIQWHLIGHLQKNKAKYAIHLFDLIHTVDSIGLAEELNRQAEKAGKIQRVLLQVKLAEEATKHGISEIGLFPLLEAASKLEYLKVEGLMIVPPFFEDPQKVRPFFQRLRELRTEAEQSGFSMPELSMGMSHDFAVAIEEGATLIRIGTALFGERQPQRH